MAASLLKCIILLTLASSMHTICDMSLDRLVAEIVAELGLTIRDARIERGWSQADLAERSGVSRATISKVESGARGTALDKVVLLGLLVNADFANLVNTAVMAAFPERRSPSTVVARRRRRPPAFDDDF